MENKQKIVRGKYCLNYTESDLQNALNEIENSELIVSEAEKKFKIPARTLRDRVNGKHNSARKYNDIAFDKTTNHHNRR
jgi:hypothetical protein